MELNLNDNQITKIKNIPDSVVELHLDHNQITEIKNIPDSVTELYLRYNQITEIKNIPNSVTELNLSGNPCYTITKNLSLNEIKFMSNFNIEILYNYIIPDIARIIHNYILYSIFHKK